MKMAAFILAVLTVAVIIFALSFHPQSASRSPELVLDDLPNGYCPDQIWLLVRASDQTTLSDQAVKITNCRQVSLQSIKPATSTTITIYGKTRHSIAFKKTVSWPVTEDVTVRPEVGDANDDNIIDQADQVIVADSLFRASPAGTALPADVDTDGAVTVIDWSLTQVNKGIGESRPDHQAWSVSVN